MKHLMAFFKRDRGVTMKNDGFQLYTIAEGHRVHIDGLFDAYSVYRQDDGSFLISGYDSNCSLYVEDKDINVKCVVYREVRIG